MRRMRSLETPRSDGEVLRRRDLIVDLERHAVSKNGSELVLNPAGV
jgi:DNA-binding response OmpR family regulator